MPLAEVQKIAAGAGRDHRGRRGRRGRHDAPRSSRPRSSRALGGTAVVRTGKEQAEESAADINDSLGFLKIALLVFAGVAVLVGGFLIFNTFAVTVAQRSREFALLRTLGASRRQVLNSVIAETLVIGFVASVAGHPRRAAARAGAARAAGLVRDRAAVHRHGDRAPHGDRRPGRRHDRHARLGPRPGAPRDPGRAGRGDARRRRRPASAASAASGCSSRSRSSASAWRRCSPACSAAPAARPRPSLLGLGMVVMIFGVALLAPVLVRPLARFIGAPLERFQGMPGRLARENAERQPQRTAITASALMIGLALVVFTAIFAAGLRGVDRQGDRRPVQPLGADRHARRRLLARPARRGRAARARSTGVDGRLADALRPGQRQGRRRLGAGHRRRPGDGHAAVPAGDRARRPRRRSRALRDDQVFASDSWAKEPRLRARRRAPGHDAVGQARRLRAGRHVRQQARHARPVPRHQRDDDEGLEPARRRVHPRRRPGQRRRAREGGEQVAGRLPGRQGADARGVQGRVRRPGQPAARARLRAAVAVGDRRAARASSTRWRSPCTSARASSACCARSA